MLLERLQLRPDVPFCQRHGLLVERMPTEDARAVAVHLAVLTPFLMDLNLPATSPLTPQRKAQMISLNLKQAISLLH